MFIPRFVASCLSAELLNKLWMNFYETFGRSRFVDGSGHVQLSIVHHIAVRDFTIVVNVSMYQSWTMNAYMIYSENTLNVKIVHRE